jgi:hypothetical protein
MLTGGCQSTRTLINPSSKSLAGVEGEQRPIETQAADIASQHAGNVLFLSKATRGDDEFALWLASKLEAAGYTVFADILKLQPCDRRRKEITSAYKAPA